MYHFGGQLACVIVSLLDFLFACLLVCYVVYLFAFSSTHLLGFSFIHSLDRPSIHPSFCPFVRSFVHSPLYREVLVLCFSPLLVQLDSQNNTPVGHHYCKKEVLTKINDFKLLIISINTAWHVIAGLHP